MSPMFFSDAPTLNLVIRTMVLGPLALIAVLVATRIVGLRSFSKMTVFDFVTTVAIGSLLAGSAAASDWSAFIQNTGAIAIILAVQVILALLRRLSEGARTASANDPVLLMKDGDWQPDALQETRVSKNDVWAKLQEANICDLTRIRAVVLESTGDIFVLHAETLDEAVLCNVRVIGGQHPLLSSLASTLTLMDSAEREIIGLI